MWTPSPRRLPAIGCIRVRSDSLTDGRLASDSDDRLVPSISDSHPDHFSHLNHDP